MSMFKCDRWTAVYLCTFMGYEMFAIFFGVPQIFDPRYGCYYWSSPSNGGWPGYSVCLDACKAHGCGPFGTCSLDALKGEDALLTPKFPAMIVQQSPSVLVAPIGVSMLQFGFCNASYSIGHIANANFKRQGSSSDFADTEDGSKLTMGAHSCGEKKCWVINDGEAELAVTAAVTEDYPPSGEWHVKCEKSTFGDVATFMPGVRLAVMEKDTFQTTIWMQPSKSACQCEEGWQGSQCREPDSSDYALSCGEERSLWMDPRLSQFIHAGLLDFPFRITNGLITAITKEAQANWISMICYAVLGIVIVPFVLVMSVMFGLFNLFLVLLIIVVCFPVLAYFKVWQVERAIIFCVPLALGREVGVNIFPLGAAFGGLLFFLACKDNITNAKKEALEVKKTIEASEVGQAIQSQKVANLMNFGAVYSSFGAIGVVCPAATGAFYIKTGLWSSFGFTCVFAISEMLIAQSTLDVGPYKFLKAFSKTIACVSNVFVTLGCKEIRDFTVYMILKDFLQVLYSGINDLISAFQGNKKEDKKKVGVDPAEREPLNGQSASP